MLTSDFDYLLPDDLIAQQPLPRGESRLLCVDESGESRHRTVRDLPRLLVPGDLLLINNTRVVPARLFARDERTGGKLEMLLVEKLSAREWLSLAKPGRRARVGRRFDLDPGLAVEVLDKRQDGRVRLRFSAPIEPHLERLGHVPLPPYIKRPDSDADRERYQTVYARSAGAIAAPTAGLHLDRALLADLPRHGVEVAELTLHVGIGTFKPVTADLVHEHRMETERFEVTPESAAAIERARAAGRRVVAVGTTVVRTLETIAARHGGRVVAGSGTTDLFITPGFRFQIVDLLLTNFHLPRSTLLMLVSAFAGRQRTMDAYREAIANRYRFYSYGDAMLTGPAPSKRRSGALPPAVVSA